ncbi:MAG: hypothetical protein J6Q53_08060 [Oscillospiraceae bacterium]|nr:hypothetical protein [Oscillospiraceae bacterium]
MEAYHALAVSYDRLTSDVEYEAVVDFYMQILGREDLRLERRWIWPVGRALYRFCWRKKVCG